MKPLEFHFDYISPFAYFSWCRIESFCDEHDLELILKPVVFGKLLDHWGQLGPAEVPPKREWLFRYAMFYAADHDLPLACPPHHPFNPLAALRASLQPVCGQSQRALVSALFHAGWGKGQDLGDPEVVCEIASGVGLDADAVRHAIGQREIKQLLKQQTDEAIALGVFGVPTLVHEGEIFWGNDQFDHLSKVIRGSYHRNEAHYQDLIKRPRASDRGSAG